MKLPRCPKTGKVGFPGKDQAEARARFIVDFMRREGHLRAYRCGFCPHWHLTKQAHKPALDNRRAEAHPSPAHVTPTGARAQ